jgi:DNA modification methylase
MTPAPNTIVGGDAMAVLRQWPDEFVQCIVTSPPYWGLRDYGTAKWEGGDAECDHRPPDDAGQTTKPTAGQREHAGRFSGPNCRKCGAIRIDAQLGLEKSPEEYVAKIVEVSREWRRVLRPDGTLWLNMGDSYVGSWGNSGSRPEIDGKTQDQREKSTEYLPRGGWDDRRDVPPNQKVSGLKPKDLCGIPWRVALALQADGWWLRSDIIWSKPNPMPESVRDRPTKSHEYVFLMSKSEKYYYDADAIKEPATDCKPRPAKSDRWIDQRGHDTKSGFIDGTEAYFERNKRDVWTVATSPFPEAHFATFPPDLIKPMVLAGSRPGDIVLDPFMGSGTVALVAKELNRKYLGIELNPEYIRMAERRLRQEVIDFANKEAM